MNFGGDFRYRGQLSLWGRPLNDFDAWKLGLGARYFPELTFEQYLSNDVFFDAEISLNAYFDTDFTTTNKNVKLYRLKFRLATPQSETRIGLQQLNFGPARILRSLRWFDRMDPRDPIGMTDGIYGIRYRYSFLNNSEIWLWGLYGNETTKGYDIFPTAEGIPEFGGRVQIPVPSGEMAATVHTRKVDTGLFSYRENKFALDGRWDIEIGCWFESVFQQSKTDVIPYEWQKFITVGLDYTFPVGNGLYAAAEHMGTIISKEILKSDEDFQVSAVMMSYPIGIMDNIVSVSYYSWDVEKFYQYLQWQRVYDYFSFNVAAFYYPETGAPSINSNDNVPMSGFGIQVMFIYNH
ncbi:hypothetical protein ACFLTH_18040 [Bacteroidota bacterium]